MNVRIVVDGLDHPECVTVDREGNLFCGGEAGQIYSLSDHDSSAEVLSTRGGLILGLCVNGNGTIYACDASGGELYARKADGKIESISRGTPNRTMQIPNYPVLDNEGNIYVSDSGSWPGGGGCIYKILPDGKTVVWSEAAHHFTNGLALDMAGEYLYVAESLLPGVTRIRILDDGSAGEAETVCLLSGTVPDGLAFDQAGRLYISCYRPDRVYRYELDGRLTIVADDFQGTDVAAPTNVVFGGEDRKTLYLASLARWHIGALELDVAGAPLRFPTNSFEGNG